MNVDPDLACGSQVRYFCHENKDCSGLPSVFFGYRFCDPATRQVRIEFLPQCLPRQLPVCRCDQLSLAEFLKIVPCIIDSWDQQPSVDRPHQYKGMSVRHPIPQQFLFFIGATIATRSLMPRPARASDSSDPQAHAEWERALLPLSVARQALLHGVGIRVGRPGRLQEVPSRQSTSPRTAPFFIPL